MRKHVSATANGTSLDADEVVISFFGPRGGTVATVGLTAKNAAKLRNELIEALEDCEEAN